MAIFYIFFLLLLNNIDYDSIMILYKFRVNVISVEIIWLKIIQMLAFSFQR